MKAQELSQKYAAAIFSLALEKWLLSLNTIQDRLADTPHLTGQLQDPERSFNDKQSILDEFLPAEVDQNIRNFLYTLIRNDDIGLLGEILATLERMLAGGPQVQTAYVTTAIALSDTAKEQFRQKLRSQYGSNLEFSFRVDPTIIGGAIVQVDDKVIDGSIANRLEAISNALGIKS